MYSLLMNERDSQRKFCPADWLCDVTHYKMLVSKGFRIMDHMTTEERTGMVHKAVENKDLVLLKAMLENGLKPVERFASYDVWRLLYEAVKASKDEEDYIEILNFLMDNGCNAELDEVEKKYLEKQQSPLCLAVVKDLWNIVDLLISRGANPVDDPGAQEAMGESFSPKLFPVLEKHNLHFHLDASPYFINGLLRGGSISPSNRDAEHYRKHQIPMLQSLIAEGLKIPDETSNEYPMAIIYNLIRFCKERSDEHLYPVVKILIEQGVDVNVADVEYKETAVCHAARCHKEKVVRLLVEKGANLNLKVHKGSPLLCLAEQECRLQNFELFKFLIESGCDVNRGRKVHRGYPQILGICMNENLKYEKHIMYLLDLCRVEVPLYLNAMCYEVVQPSILYKLVQTGLDGPRVLVSILRHALKTQNHRGYELVRQVWPDVLELQGYVDGNLDYDIFEDDLSYLSQRILEESRNPYPLVNWAIYAIRNYHLTSNYISILPGLRKLATKVPVDLRPMLTLDYYMVNDQERCLLTAQHNEDRMYSHNRPN